MKGIFLGRKEVIDTVYLESTKNTLRENIDIDTEYTLPTDEIYSNAELLSDIDVVFSSWGMPTPDGTAVSKLFPKLKAIYYAAGSVQTFAGPFFENGVKIYSAWAANGVPVEIHSYPRSSIPDDVCSPLRLRRVLHEHPGLCMPIAHLGGFQHEELCGLDAYFNFSAVLPDLVERCGTEQANRILRAFGTDRLIFATDYPDSRCLRPAQIYDRYFELLGSMDFTQAEAERICRENIKNMLRCGAKDGIL